MEELGIFASGSKKRIKTENRIQDEKNQHTTEREGKSELLDGKASTIVISVVENRAREISICKMDTSMRSDLEVFLLTDSHSYNETILTIRSINPDEILLPDAWRTKTLSKRIETECRDDARVLFISRQYFDQDRGADLLKKVLHGNVDADLIAKYIVLSGAYCLLRYVENCSGSTFASNSLRVEYGATSSVRMNVDRRTAINLELICNAKTGKQKESLFGVINHTKTAVGARLLRSNILRPSTDIITINTRLDLVEDFIKNNRVFSEVVGLLSSFPDLDKMLSGLVAIPKNITLKTARIGIDTLIYLKQSLKLAPNLAAAIKNLKSASDSEGVSSEMNPLLIAMVDNFIDPEFAKVEESIMSMLLESTTYNKSSHAMRHQECFAIKNGIHGLLDVARKTFLQTVEDIYALAEQYSMEFGVPIKVVHNTSRGHYLLVPSSLCPLPAGFTQAVLNKKSIACSTEEFSSLSDRASEAITTALKITHELIQSLLSDIRKNINCLFTLTDSVALLDMLLSFADLVALNPHPFSRPILNDEGPMVIKAGRHPVVSSLPQQQMSSSFVPNDLFISSLDNMHIVSGPNGSGKTVYIKQIALIVVMAQIGCFVPAHHATVPVRDRLLSRLGTSDDMEHNMSTFFTEMKETAYILENITHRSLVIIDELGRGTSNVDGMSIAFAIAESLLDSNAITLFVTHYPQITYLAHLYQNAKNVHLKTSIDLSLGGDSAIAADSIKYLHLVGSGPCDMRSGYGIMMADACGFPKEVLDDARALRKVVRESYPLMFKPVGTDDNDTSAVGNEDSSQRAITNILQHLLLLKDSDAEDRDIRHYLQTLRQRIPKSASESILQFLKREQEREDDSNKKSSESVLFSERSNSSTSSALMECELRLTTPTKGGSDETILRNVDSVGV